MEKVEDDGKKVFMDDHKKKMKPLMNGPEDK